MGTCVRECMRGHMGEKGLEVGRDMGLKGLTEVGISLYIGDRGGRQIK